MAKILLLHGPNLNLLGIREPSLYGDMTLQAIDQQLTEQATEMGHDLSILQSNAEHVLIDKVHQAKLENIQFILINPGAFAHTSVALRDGLLAVKIPFIEVHLTNIHNRETFRHHSYLSDCAVGVISGFGSQSYELALAAAHKQLT